MPPGEVQNIILLKPPKSLKFEFRRAVPETLLVVPYWCFILTRDLYLVKSDHRTPDSAMALVQNICYNDQNP